MTKFVYQQSVFTGSDCLTVAPFASATVTNAADDTAASLWEDEVGATPITGNVVQADEFGFVQFYASAGFYNILIEYGSISQTLSNVQIGADAAGVADSAVSAHASATDPHGDRSYSDGAISSAISSHTGATDPHGDRAFATSAVSSHASASDPHGDRAYADSAVSSSLTLNTKTKTAAYQLTTVDGDGKTVLRMDVATAHDVTIPPDDTAEITLNRPILVRWCGAGQPTIVAASGVTANGTLTFNARYDAKMLVRIAANTWDVYGA